uniref:Uncharacterized protein n=1 Tax=Arundo donax TaxID=35708 RepID=A0A0A9FY48_ARUDO
MAQAPDGVRRWRDDGGTSSVLLFSSPPSMEEIEEPTIKPRIQSM